MRNIRSWTIAFIFALLAVLVPSCEKDFLRGGPAQPERLNGVAMTVKSASSSSLLETKAGGHARPSNAFSSEDGGLVIEEYVSDIDVETPVTKGTEIKQPVAGSGNFSVSGRQFKVMAYIDTLNSAKEKVHLNDFDLVTMYDGSSWDWDCAAKDIPCWRDSTKYHVWSYWPLDSDLTGNSRSSVSVPGWSTGDYARVTFHHSVPKPLEAQQDLLFAYNEELREFKHDSNGDFPIDPVTQEPVYELETGQTGYFDIKFQHALAAVKFELNSTIAGSNIDVHSITLCCTDNTTAHNILLNSGIATSGYCEATGSVETVSNVPSSKINFVWKADSLKNRKPLHYEFDSSHSVAGNYTTTGNGILFMIPQALPSGLKIIVEFSKNGSLNYNTKVVNLPAVTWAAGKYYTYRLKIGELHVPGEKMAELTDVWIKGLKPSGATSSFKRPETPIPIKGVTRVGLIINGYGLGTKPLQTVHMYSNAYAADNSVPAAGSGFQFDFTNYTDIDSNTISFGNGTTETYYDKYTFAVTEGQNKNPSNNGVEAYYVFNTNNKDTFFLYFRQDAQDNSGGFHAFLKGLYVLEVAPDPNLPGNFGTIDWDNI